VISARQARACQTTGMQAQLEPLGGALQLTELRNLLDVVLEQAVSGLRELAAQLPSKADDARSAARRAATLGAALHDTAAVLSTLRPRSRLLASLLSRASHADLGINMDTLAHISCVPISVYRMTGCMSLAAKHQYVTPNALLNSSPHLATHHV
jgi:hypothetical protein